LKQGGTHCDCGADKCKDSESIEEAKRRVEERHATWCGYPSDPCCCRKDYSH